MFFARCLLKPVEGSFNFVQYLVDGGFGLLQHISESVSSIRVGMLAALSISIQQWQDVAQGWHENSLMSHLLETSYKMIYNPQTTATVTYTLAS
jgi:hypothetical protein